MKIDADSLVDIQYTLTWQSSGVSHVERYFGSSVNMWRDFFPAAVYESLEGLSAGQRADFAVKVIEFFDPAVTGAGFRRGDDAIHKLQQPHVAFVFIGGLNETAKHFGALLVDPSDGGR